MRPKNDETVYSIDPFWRDAALIAAACAGIYGVIGVLCAKRIDLEPTAEFQEIEESAYQAGARIRAKIDECDLDEMEAGQAYRKAFTAGLHAPTPLRQFPVEPPEKEPK